MFLKSLWLRKFCGTRIIRSLWDVSGGNMCSVVFENGCSLRGSTYCGFYMKKDSGIFKVNLGVVVLIL